MKFNTCVASSQRSATRTQCWATQTKGGNMTWWEVRSPAAQVTLTGGASTSTEVSRLTSLPRTSSTCSSEVASPPVSQPTRRLPIYTLLGAIWGDSTSTVAFLSAASPHTFNNGRTSYSQDTDYRQERTDDRGDVRTLTRHCSWLPSVCVLSLRVRLTLAFPPGWLFHVHPADAYRGPDPSVNTEPDDGVAPALQPLLETVRACHALACLHPRNKHTLDFFFYYS